MYFDDHKKIATMIVSKKDGKGNPIAAPTAMKPEIVKTEDGEMDGKHAAAQDAISAFHEKSAEKLKGALSNFIDLHMSGDSKDLGSD